MASAYYVDKDSGEVKLVPPDDDSIAKAEADPALRQATPYEAQLYDLRNNQSGIPPAPVVPPDPHPVQAPASYQGLTPFVTAAESAAAVPTWGGSSAILEGLGALGPYNNPLANYGKEALQRKEENPGGAMVGTALGILPDGLINAAGKAGQLGYEGVRGALSTPSAGIGKAVTEGAANILGKAGALQGPSLVSKIVKQAITRGAGSAVETGLFTGSQLMDEKVLGNPNLSGDKAFATVMDSLGSSAEWGGGIGAVFGAGAGAVDRWLGNRTIVDTLKDAEADQALKMTKAPQAAIDKRISLLHPETDDFGNITKPASTLFHDKIKELLEPVSELGGKPLIEDWATPDKIDTASKTLQNKIGPAIGELTEDYDYSPGAYDLAGNPVDNRYDATRLVGDMYDNVIKPMLSEPTTEAAGNKLMTILEGHLENIKQEALDNIRGEVTAKWANKIPYKLDLEARMASGDIPLDITGNRHQVVPLTGYVENPRNIIEDFEAAGNKDVYDTIPYTNDQVDRLRERQINYEVADRARKLFGSPPPPHITGALDPGFVEISNNPETANELANRVSDYKLAASNVWDLYRGEIIPRETEVGLEKAAESPALMNMTGKTMASDAKAFLTYSKKATTGTPGFMSSQDQKALKKAIDKLSQAYPPFGSAQDIDVARASWDTIQDFMKDLRKIPGASKLVHVMDNHIEFSSPFSFLNDIAKRHIDNTQQMQSALDASNLVFPTGNSGQVLNSDAKEFIQDLKSPRSDEHKLKHLLNATTTVNNDIVQFIRAHPAPIGTVPDIDPLGRRVTNYLGDIKDEASRIGVRQAIPPKLSEIIASGESPDIPVGLKTLHTMRKAVNKEVNFDKANTQNWSSEYKVGLRRYASKISDAMDSIMHNPKTSEQLMGISKDERAKLPPDRRKEYDADVAAFASAKFDAKDYWDSLADKYSQAKLAEYLAKAGMKASKNKPITAGDLAALIGSSTVGAAGGHLLPGALGTTGSIAGVVVGSALPSLRNKYGASVFKYGLGRAGKLASKLPAALSNLSYDIPSLLAKEHAVTSGEASGNPIAPNGATSILSPFNSDNEPDGGSPDAGYSEGGVIGYADGGILGQEQTEADEAPAGHSIADIQRVEALAALERNNSNITNKIREGSSRVVRAQKPVKARNVTTAGVHKDSAKPVERQQAIHMKHASLIRSMANPDAMAEQLGDMTGNLGEHAPQTTAAMQTTATRAVQFLQSKLPEASTQSAIGPEWQPSAPEISKYNQYKHAVEKPLSILESATTGTLTPEAVEAVRTVYPDLYQEMQNELMNATADHRDMPMRARMATNLLMGQDLSGEATGSDLVAGQYAMGDQKPSAEGMPSGGGKHSLKDLNIASQFQTPQQKVVDGRESA